MRALSTLFGKGGSETINKNSVVQTLRVHENGELLYQDNQRSKHLKSRSVDYYLSILIPGMFLGVIPMYCYPAMIGLTAFFIKSKFNTDERVFHAELLPHTEQIVFVKIGHFGTLKRSLVNVKDLQRVDLETLPKVVTFGFNRNDSRMVFQDMTSGEFFLFGREGTWNETTLAHKLLY